eukprot:COSAG06_NODE_18305_length_894_cov_1.150943_1_plen_45_part_10
MIIVPRQARDKHILGRALIVEGGTWFLHAGHSKLTYDNIHAYPTV